MADRLEQVRALLPPEGADLTQLFGGDAGTVSTGELVKDDATVSFTSRNAENTREGPEGFREGWADWLEPWESYRIHHEDLVERGDRVVALVRLRGVTKRDGVEMEHAGAAIFRFEGDVVVNIEFSLDPEAALAD
jgi:ketosteroid isomerase-like protein